MCAVIKCRRNNHVSSPPPPFFCEPACYSCVVFRSFMSSCPILGPVLHAGFIQVLENPRKLTKLKNEFSGALKAWNFFLLLEEP